MGCPIFPRLHGVLCRGEHAKSTRGRSVKSSVEIPREGIKRDQKYSDQYHGGIPHAVRLFLFFQEIGDRGAEEKNLQAREDARGSFHKRKFMKQCHNKNRAADRRGRQAHQHGEHVSIHRPSLTCSGRIIPLFCRARAARISASFALRFSAPIFIVAKDVHWLLATELVSGWAPSSSNGVK